MPSPIERLQKKFPSLIGRLTTPLRLNLLGLLIKFPSLIGRLTTIAP